MHSKVIRCNNKFIRKFIFTIKLFFFVQIFFSTYAWAGIGYAYICKQINEYWIGDDGKFRQTPLENWKKYPEALEYKFTWLKDKISIKDWENKNMQVPIIYQEDNEMFIAQNFDITIRFFDRRLVRVVNDGYIHKLTITTADCDIF